MWTRGNGLRLMEWRNASIVLAGCLAVLAWLITRRGMRVQAEAVRLLSDVMKREGEVVRAERQVAESLEKLAGLTAPEARQLVVARAAEHSRAYIDHLVSSAEREASAEATKRARWILVGALAQVTQFPDHLRYRNLVKLPDEHGLRARLVGRDGSNLAAFTELTGVQLSLHEGRPFAVLASFDPERRAIAEEVLSILVTEPRVYEGTIREAYDDVIRRWPSRLLFLGREAAATAGAGELSDGLASLMGRLHYERVQGVSALGQAVMGARIASVLAAEIGWPNPQLVVRAAFLRDLGYAVTTESGSHAEAGADLAAREGEADEVCQAIRQHHLFAASHRDVVSSLVACAERLTVDGTESPYESPKLAATRLRDVETALEGLTGVTSARVLGLATEVSVWVDPVALPEAALQDLTLQAAEVVQERVSKPITITVHRHTAMQVRPHASITPIRWLIDPGAPSPSDG